MTNLWQFYGPYQRRTEFPERDQPKLSLKANFQLGKALRNSPGFQAGGKTDSEFSGD